MVGSRMETHEEGPPLNLMPIGAGTNGTSWSILATPITVPVQLTAAVSLSSDDDQYQVVWLRPNGSGLEAIGSYSGVSTRATPCDAACQQRRRAQIEMYVEPLKLQPTYK